MTIKLINDDCINTIKDLADNSVDAVITDPPYELGFMGKAWDSTGIANNQYMWSEVLRVLKHGGYLLSFGGTRTYHRMACAIEDAGFEVRDMIEWVYGSGFPKSLNIGKAVDKINGETGRKEKFTKWMRTTGITATEINKITNSFMGSHYLTAKDQPAIPTRESWAILRPQIKTEIPKWVDELVERIEREREVVGERKQRANSENSNIKMNGCPSEVEIVTKGASKWEGWGTALKPAHEPLCMARKPLSEKTVAENCLKWGTGGINIDESRVGTEKMTVKGGSNSLGRFPANLIHDNSEDVRECFLNESERFFKSIIYQAKASKSERGECNKHPTVKPIKLIEYLINMLSREGGIILDPFMGSGTTGVACKNLNRNFIGIELNKEYFEIAEKRINIELIPSEA